MVVDIINNFVGVGFDFIVNTILTPVITIIKNFSGDFYSIVLLICSLIISYFLAKWEKFVDVITGKFGLIVLLTILLFIIFNMIGGRI